MCDEVCDEVCVSACECVSLCAGVYVCERERDKERERVSECVCERERQRVSSGKSASDAHDSERLVSHCRTTNASTAPCTPRKTCFPYAYVLNTVLRVSRFCELFTDGFDLQLSPTGS